MRRSHPIAVATLASLAGLALALLPSPAARAQGSGSIFGPAPAQSGTAQIERAGNSAQSVEDALAEMVELEARLEQAQQRRQRGEQALDAAGNELGAAERTAQTQRTTSEHGLELLQAYDERLGSNQAQLRAGIDMARTELEQRKATLRLARLALLARSSTATEPHGAGAGGLLTLAQIDARQRERAGAIAARMLRSEARIAELAGARSEVDDSARYHGAFSEFSARQLRARHQALAEHVAELRSGIESETQSVADLTARRGELKGLIERLSQEQAEDEAQAAAERAAQAALKPGAPAVRPHSATTPAPEAAAEVGYEAGSEPLLSQAAPAGTAMDGTAAAAGGEMGRDGNEGTRQLFWRASPVGVRAPVAGRVVFSGEVAGYRHMLILDHGDGWHTIYGNMIDTVAHEGQQLPAGTRLGTYQAGQGRRAEPFVFEIYKRDKAVPPQDFPYLADGWQTQLFESTDGGSAAR